MSWLDIWGDKFKKAAEKQEEKWKKAAEEGERRFEEVAKKQEEKWKLSIFPEEKEESKGEEAKPEGGGKEGSPQAPKGKGSEECEACVLTFVHLPACFRNYGPKNGLTREQSEAIAKMLEDGAQMGEEPEAVFERVLVLYPRDKVIEVLKECARGLREGR